MARQPRIGSSRLQEGGQLATHKQDFNAHVEGGGFRHTADNIDMNPQLSQFPADTVQETLQLIASLSASEGSGFISIGKTTSDGYAVGSYNVTDTVDLETALQNAFADSRLQNGGIVLILAGTYRINNTVQVPPGITIMGDGPGTVVIGEMAEIPMFKFQQGIRIPAIGGDTGIGPEFLEQGAPLDQGGLKNIIITDNSDGYVQSSGEPIASMITTPMVLLEVGSKTKFDGVKFIGRINNGPVLNRLKTLRAIGTETTGSEGTHLEVNNCYFDGLATGIRFETGNDSADTLIIRNCRARVFGDEGTGTPDNEANTFAALTLCRLTADNNYVIGATSANARISNVFYILSGSPDNTFLNISNTSGRSSQSGSTVRLVLAASSINYRGSVTNNIWGGDTADGWSVFIGGPGADFVGEGAIDLFLSLTSPEFGPANLYIFGANTYTITEPGSNRYNFIGITNGVITQPVINLNLDGSAPNDEFGRRRFDCGNVIKNVRFISDSVGQFHVVRPGGNSSVGGITVEKSVLVDVGVSVNDSASSAFPSAIRIEDCDFLRNNFNNNLALLLPNVHDSIVIDGCTFGGGYAGFIGTDGSYGTTLSSSPTILNVRNCRFEPGSITATNSLSRLAYFAVGEVAKCEVENCIFLEGEESAQLINSTVWDAGLRSFYFFEANDFSLKSSVINGTIGTFDGYHLVGTQVVPRNSLFVDGITVNSSVFQIGGDVNSFLENGTVTNSFFYSDESAILTQLDVDLANSNTSSDSTFNLKVDNCFFRNIAEQAAPVEHADTDVYDELGAVQIFVQNCNLSFTNNKVFALVENSLPSSFVALNGVVLDNTKVSVDLPTSLIVSNNNIVVENAFNPGAGEVASALFVRTAQGRVDNNDIRFNNKISPSNGNHNCIYFDSVGPLVSTNDVAERVFQRVTSNTLSRRDDDGVGTDLRLGYVYANDSGGGTLLVTQNTFSDDTIDGSDDSVIGDNFAVDSEPFDYDNYNQIYQVYLHYDGLVGVATSAGGDPFVGELSSSSITSTINSWPNPSTIAYEFNYNDTGNRRDFYWRINLDNKLPPGAIITRVQATVDVTANVAGGGSSSKADLTVFLGSSFGTIDSVDPLTTAGGSLEVLPPSTNNRMSRTSNNYIEIEYECQSTSTTIFRIGRIQVEYKL